MKRSKHGLSYTKLLSCDLGELIPCGLMEILPGDSVQLSTAVLLRCAPMLAPVMHPVDVRVHHWFVPNRLIWSNWENFITGGPDGLNASVYPTITFGGGSGAAVGSLADYLGITPGVNNLVASALPFRGYAKIFNDWYRDQDLVTALALSTADGNDVTTSTALQNCAWEKDYFTSARPWEQKGPAVTIPLVGNAPVLGVSVRDNAAAVNNVGASIGSVAAADLAAGSTPTWRTDTQELYVRAQSNAVPSSGNRPQVFADLSSVAGVTVNSLRQALAVQRFEEWRARYGSRYVEYLAALGVRSSDARLDRPEYLGGGKAKIQFSEVLQTGPGADPVGDLKGHGIAAMRSNRIRRFFEEHGYLFTLLSVRPKTIYANGLPRTFNRRTKLDFWQKELEHIGQQPILNKEVYAAHASPDGTFGYQDRYDEYRRMESSIAGEFRTSQLDFWHLARIFASSPALNSTFVQSVPTERSFAVPSEDVLQIHCKHSVQARRLVSKVGNSFIF